MSSIHEQAFTPRELADFNERIKNLEKEFAVMSQAIKEIASMKNDIHDIRQQSMLQTALAEQRKEFEVEQKEQLKDAFKTARDLADRRDRWILAFCALFIPAAFALLFYALDHRIYQVMNQLIAGSVR